MAEAVDFLWWRCLNGYRLSAGGLESVGKQFEQYRPLEDLALFVKFARDTPASPQGMLQFCNRYGLVGGRRPDIPSSSGRPTSESLMLDVLLQHHAELRGAYNLFERKNDASKLLDYWNSKGRGLLRVELRQNEAGLNWVLVPPDLIAALWFQFGQYACAGAARLFRCQHCNEPFTVGIGTGRRSTAKYCSNRCKVAAFKARQESRSNAG
jgi:hypothetical protein